MKKSEKTIALLVIVSLVLSITLGVFAFKTRKAFALDGGGSWAQAIKETVLDAIGWTVTDQVLNRLMQKIQDWGLGRETDSNEPFFVMDWQKFWETALDVGSGKFINEFNLTKLCRPIGLTLGEQFGLTTYYGDKPRYRDYAACTLQDVIDNVENFYKNPSISIYGWNAWTTLTQPQNNLLGSAVMAIEKKEEMEQAELDAKNKETDISQGTKNETVTTKTDTEACMETCKTNASDWLSNCRAYCNSSVSEENRGVCLNNCTTSISGDPSACNRVCETKTKGLAIGTKIKNWGKDINKAMEDALGKDINRIISADEISELIGVFFSAVLNKAMTGLGLAPQTTSAGQKSIDREQLRQDYSYSKTIQKKSTPEELREFRSAILANILKAMQQLSKSIISCEEKEMMTIDDYAKNLSDIFASEVEALYVGLEGTNLKPDFEVLDPAIAPFSVNGYGWGHIPYNKFPSKCKKITDQLSLGDRATCIDIISGLEPNYNSRCKECMYDYNEMACPIGPVPPIYPPAEIPESIIKQKQDFYNNCKSWYLTALQRCNDCIKKADERCSTDNPTERVECITGACDNYQDIESHITSTITDGYDFYNKCLIEEKKDACYSCTKEYFMPATFCDQTQDYMARSIMKYSTLVKFTRSASEWWSVGGFLKGGIIGGIIGAVLSSDDKGMWIGPYDKNIGDMGGECNDNYEKEKLSLATICRIMPDFSYLGTTCRQCFKNGMTETELTDTIDFRPSDKDCGNIKVDIGGREPYSTIIAGVLRTKSKCCAALWGHNKKHYETCLGSGINVAGINDSCTYTKPVEQEPWCYCKEDERPLGWGKTKPYDEYTDPATINYCRDFEFDSPGQKRLRVYTDSTPGGAIIYIARGSCNYSGTDPINQRTASDPGQIIWSVTTPYADGMQEYYYDFSETGTLHAGVYDAVDHIPATGHNRSTSMHLCAPCNPDDEGYPEYGTAFDQCAGKIQPQ